MEQNSNFIEKIADRMIFGGDTVWGMNIQRFDWVPGVGLYGIWKAWEVTRQEKYLNFLKDWSAEHLQEAYAQKTVNSTAPLLTVLMVWQETGDPALFQVCADIAAYILEEAPRTRDGGLEHTVTEDVEGFAEQMWADTLFMVCVFMARMGKAAGNERYTDFARQQLAVHLRALRDRETGLYYHGWNCTGRNHMSGIRWGRANAWILYSMAEILSVTEGTTGDQWNRFAESAAAIRGYQRENGAFGTILDDPAAYDEISATAGIVAGMAVGRRRNVLDASYDPVIEKGLCAVRNAVRENGEVGGVSGGTPVMADADAYKAVPIYPTLYGQGLAAAALAEARRLAL